MENPDSLTCFDCPTVCEINHLLGESRSVRQETEDRTVHALNEFAQMDNSDPEVIALRERWTTISETGLEALDKVDKNLTTNLVALLETCAEMRPTLTNQLGNNALQCSSVLAKQVESSIHPTATTQ